jgi:hypothetical protein
MRAYPVVAADLANSFTRFGEPDKQKAEDWPRG